MKEELDALTKNHTWDLVTLPPRQSVVGCKWIYKIKTRSDGFIERYKTCLVAKGFTQEYGIDYEETFTPVARISSVRALLAVAATIKWDIFQMEEVKKFICNLLLISLLNQTRFVTFDVHFIVLNKLHELGLPNSTLPSLAWVTWLVIMILPYFFIVSTKALFYFSCMWMIWS